MTTPLRSLVAIILIFCVQFSNAQTHCGSTPYMQAQMHADTGLARRMQQIEQFTQNYIATHPNGNDSRAVITVPVVFHVLYNTAAQNIADAFCQAQIDQLNLDYARLNADAANTPAAFASIGANTNIQFCLAQRDPNGAATTGIIHKSTTVTSFSDNDAAKYSSRGGDDAWPAASYLNIWSCNLGGGLLGYSQFPGGAAATDGCVILYNSIGSVAHPTTATPYNLGRTITHEVGHWLNLYHVWGDDNGACTGTDNVADTPNQGAENYGCPTFPHTDNCTTTSPGVVFMDYMDYTDDACMNLFTQGQSARMNALFASGGVRVSILSSLGCTPIGPVCALATGLTTTAITTTSATVSWTAVSGAASYNLQYRVVGTTTWTTVSVTGTTRNVTGLTPNTNYEWQIQTVCTNGGTSSFTASATFTTSGPPVANFVADVTSSCSGTINFTDSTKGGPTSWAWTFGDGTTSNIQNPQHQYFTNGTFTVTLTASNSNGTNTATKSNYITINKPAAPTATGGSHCGPGSVSLSSSSADTIKWYANATDAAPVATGSTYTTPSLNASTTYYVEGTTPGTTTTVGPAAYNTLGAGGYFSNSTDQYLIFNCLAPCTLKSVLVYAQSAGTRVIALRDSAGNTLQSLSVNLAAGTSTVALNFALPVGNNLEMAINGTSNLYRNSNVTAGYPFTLAGLVSITSSSAGTGYYYNFYNWQIAGASCVTLRAPVAATITAGLSATAATTNVGCFGANNGSASLTVSGGTPAYTYAWSNGQTTSTLTAVAQGNYTVTVSDVTGCSGTQTVAVSQPAQLLLSANSTNASCGLNNGGVTAVTSGGSPAYSFHWNNSATTSAISNLAAGSFTVTVTDSHSCTATASASVVTSGSLNIVPTVQNISCFGAVNGSISVAASGGTPSYNYQWGGSQTGNQLNNLAAGQYTVSVTDASGCSATQTISITQPAVLQVVTRVTNASCGQSNGAVTTSVAGGTPNYAYAWDNGATTSAINNLSSGTYNVTVTDNKSCTATATATVASSGSLVITPSAVNIVCPGAATGAASVGVSGGSPAYTYVWSNGATVSSVNSVTAGNYVVTVTDIGGCSATANIAVTEPAAMGITSHVNQPLCNGENNGSIYINVNGGTPVYNYVWSNSATGNTITNLVAGNYSVTITDANSCSTSSAITLSDVPVLSISFVTTNVNCHGDSTGDAGVSVSGGTPAYTYSWNTGSASTGISGLTAGSYVITVSDNHNCTASATAVITQPAAIVISTTSTNAATGQNNGSVAIQSVSGAITPVAFLWSTGDTSQTVSNLGAGVYTVTATDVNGCSQTTSVTVNSGPTSAGTVNGDILFSIYPNPAATELTVAVGNLSDGGILSITNTLGQKFNEEAIKQNTASVKIDVSKLAAGIYLVELRSGNSWTVKQVVISH